MALSIRCVRDNERESDGSRKFSSTHSQVNMMGKTGNIHNICTKDSYL